MARIHHDSSVNEIIGSLNSKNGLTIRKKHFHDYNGNITREGRLEVFKPNPRDYKTHPATRKEAANQHSFGSASHLAQEFIDALKYKTPLSPQKQAFLDSCTARFYAQLKGAPDPVAPKDRDGNYVIYARIDNFIRAVLRKEKPVF